MKVKSSKKKLNPVLADKGISQSGLYRFLECRQKAKLAVDGWVLKRKSHALRFGSIWHSCLEFVYTLPSTAKKLLPKPEDIAALRRNLIKEYESNAGLASSEEMEDTQLDIEVAIVLLKAYLKRYPDDFKKKAWVGVEEEVRVPYEGKNLLGFIDGVYRLDKGLWLLETKTKGRIMESMVDMLHFDFQSLYYLHLYLLKHGELPKGILYNITRKPQLKRGASESIEKFCLRLEEDVDVRPEFYFLRYEILIPKDEYEAWVVKELRPILEDYWKWGVEEGCSRSYKNTTMCETKYGACQFLPICSIGNYEPFENKNQKRGGK